jgi:glycosyltransferase involved in cell wall biosynthesis
MKRTLVLVNSRYSLNAVKRLWKRDGVVLYPPVDVDRFLQVFNEDRAPIVVTCGRLTPEKKLDMVPLVAKELRDVRFFVVGGMHNIYGKIVLEKIEKLCKRYDLKNVAVLPNLSFEDLLKLYGRASVYLHTMPGEHFGLAVVEAMASGLIPVVHKIGGAWTDIVEEGKYGYGFTSPAEAVECIREALNNSRLRKTVSKRAEEFSKSVFKKKLNKIINSMIGH